MNKKIKQIAVFLGMLALGLTLTACSTNKDTKKATPKKPEKSQYNLRPGAPQCAIYR